MNIIFGKHDGCNKDFIWEVPDNMTLHISKGDLLLVDTHRGADIATATTNVISGVGATDVAEMNGAYFPLKGVISFVNQKMADVIVANITKNTQNLNAAMDNLKKVADEICRLNKLPY